jgi:membrane-associated phospholipid phosphatase
MRTFVHNFDTKITALIKQVDGLQGLMTVFTTLGHPVVTLGIGAGVMVLGGFKANSRVVYSGLAVLLTIGIGSVVKLFLRRDRPLTEYVSQMLFSTFSFPSGHTVGATVAYGLLAYLAWNFFPQPWSSIAVGLLVGLIIMVGLSRIYLGAHYPSDVAAGYLVGLAGLLVIIFFIKPLL